MDVKLANNIRVVLLETSHPGNIGAAARAMKTMGLTSLTLVNPKRFPSADATARAAGADDILYHACVYSTLSDALADCVWVIGTTARSRYIQWPVQTPRECALQLVSKAASATVALVFGREHSGMTNQELELCHGLVRIPTNPDFSSLNLAAAVQIIAYEIQLAAHAPDRHDVESNWQPVSGSQMEGFYTHLEQSLVAIGYLDPVSPRLLMRRLRRLFNRTAPDRSELNILRGILTAIQKIVAKVGS